MQPKISRRQKLAIIVMAAVDVIMLVLAAILDSLRESLPAEYLLTDGGDIVSSHPLDRFGIFVAAALALVTIMFAFALVNIINSEDKKRRIKAIGFTVLFVVSAAVVMFSYLWVRGSQPERTVTYDYTDSDISLLLMEESYSDDFGTLRVFITNEAHDETALLAATDIHSRSESSDDYYIDWVMDGMLRITFLDADSYRSIQIDLMRVLDTEQQNKFLASAESDADNNDQEHEHDHEHE